MIIPIRRGSDRIAVEIDDKHANAMFGPVELWMLAEKGAGINLWPFAPSVPATMPTDEDLAERREKKPKRREAEHDDAARLI